MIFCSPRCLPGGLQTRAPSAERARSGATADARLVAHANAFAYPALLQGLQVPYERHQILKSYWPVDVQEWRAGPVKLQKSSAAANILHAGDAPRGTSTAYMRFLADLLHALRISGERRPILPLFRLQGDLLLPAPPRFRHCNRREHHLVQPAMLSRLLLLASQQR